MTCCTGPATFTSPSVQASTLGQPEIALQNTSPPSPPPTASDDWPDTRRECRDCRAQAGLRTRTVMARSPVRLWQWFEAIRWILWRPTIDTSELAEKLGIRRPTTVRAMAKKIRAALAAEDGSQQLAGLDVHYGRRDAAT